MSEIVIPGQMSDEHPRWLAERGAADQVDFVFLDGGDNPLEQIIEFKLLADRIPVGGRLMAHDAKSGRANGWRLTFHCWTTGRCNCMN
jgi:hypothetical protein